ncbi:hypothetical protein ASD8599_01727 [Ascidiaceihabitans donghaensis]|uniref:Uncharacterized protein n=1 Tax=Ascidiaceihabitans donghaensis TaxID=1510460 RepID=A0A2R8BD37_9RHOB|nr:hypothetical protein ASD8599_01727 [Ascidiaceihabitans donghaensis]
MTSFWHNFRTFRQNTKGKPRVERIRCAELLRSGPCGVMVAVMTTLVIHAPELKTDE